VILAGGRGTRLRFLTDSCPKPMIAFHGRPFLEYLIEMLREQGFERVLLLLGYLPDVITDYFGNGREFGVDIDYAITDAENDTGRRLKLAAGRIESRFLLMYCDNYWPMRIDPMMHAYSDRGAQAQVVVYRNRDGYTRDNIRVDAAGFVEIYDKRRSAPGLTGVDIGFLIAERAILDLLPENENVSFEATVYPQLVEGRQFSAFETDHRYYSVSTPERLPETDRFLARHPSILLDRDGVLNCKAPTGEYVRSWDEWSWLPGARDALRNLNEAGYQVIVITNQAGVARGAMTEDALEAIHTRMKEEAEKAGGRIDTVYYCPHDCRKPAPGMLLQAQREFRLDLSRVAFIGDDTRDGEAAARAGCPFYRVDGETSLLDIVQRLENVVSPIGGQA